MHYSATASGTSHVNYVSVTWEVRLAPVLHFLIRATALFVPGIPMTTAADWKPDKVIEFIVPTGPGSGVDSSARTVQQIFQSNKLVEQAINTTNKPGGNYGIAMNISASSIAMRTS